MTIQFDHGPQVHPQGLERLEGQYVDLYPFAGEMSLGQAHRAQSRFPVLSAEDDLRLREALQSEVRFLSGKGIRFAGLPEGADTEQLHRYFERNNIGKLGLRNVQVAEGSLSANFVVVPFPTYQMFNRSTHEGLRTFGANLGAAAILVTSDGKLLLQDRSPANKVWGGVGGASIAGFVDVPPDAGEALDLSAVVRRHLFAEGEEEIGCRQSILERLTPTGFVVDKVALHNEITFFARISLTSDEAAVQAYSNSQRNTGIAFSENLVIVDATPEVIEQLLTRIKTPFPTTHAAPILMLGDQLLEEAGAPLTQRIAWVERVFRAMNENYREIDTRAGGKFNPNTSSAEQGIPLFREELCRVFEFDHRYVNCAW